MNDKRRTWEACKQDQELARIIRIVSPMLKGKGAEIKFEKPDGEVVRWRNE